MYTDTNDVKFKKKIMVFISECFQNIDFFQCYSKG